MPESGIIYRRKLKNKYPITISRTLFLRSMETLVEAAEDVRTYSVPDTVHNTSESAFEHSKVLKAVRLNTGIKNASADLLSNPAIQTLICLVAPEDVERFLTNAN